MELKDKVAVVTGGAKGIGFGIIEEILKEGAKHVVIVDINSIDGSNAVTTLNSKYGDEKAHFIKADVTKDLDTVFDETVAKYKTIDILVNNAGIYDEDDLHRTININLVATMQWSLKFMEHMRRDNGGAGGIILNISSMAAYVIDPYMMFYRASKFGVLGFTKSLGHGDIFAVTGVRVIALCPALTKTELVGNIRPNRALQFLADKLSDALSVYNMQDVDSVSKAAKEVIKNAKPGSTWYVKSGENVKQVPAEEWVDNIYGSGKEAEWGVSQS